MSHSFGAQPKQQEKNWQLKATYVEVGITHHSIERKLTLHLDLPRAVAGSPR
jgi:hypothetical protein